MPFWHHVPIGCEAFVSDRKMQGIVAVFGGNREDPPVLDLAAEVGVVVAGSGAILLTGGRHDVGSDHVKDSAMAAGAAVAGSRLLGVLPGSGPATRVELVGNGGRAGYVKTGLGDARNVVNGYACDAAIVLPGGAGTISEIVYSIHAARPVVLLGWDTTTLRSRFRRSRSDVTDLLEKGALAFPNAALPRAREAERVLEGGPIDVVATAEESIHVVGGTERNDRGENARDLLTSNGHGAIANRLALVMDELTATRS